MGFFPWHVPLLSLFSSFFLPRLCYFLPPPPSCPQGPHFHISPHVKAAIFLFFFFGEGGLIFWRCPPPLPLRSGEAIHHQKTASEASSSASASRSCLAVIESFFFLEGNHFMQSFFSWEAFFLCVQDFFFFEKRPLWVLEAAAVARFFMKRLRSFSAAPEEAAKQGKTHILGYAIHG